MGESPVRLLAGILHKAQGRIDQESGLDIDVGREVTRLRKHCILAAEQIERLERENKVLRSQVSILKKHLQNFDHFYPDGFQENDNV